MIEYEDNRTTNNNNSENNIALGNCGKNVQDTTLKTFFGSNEEKTCQIIVYIQLCPLLRVNLLIFPCV